MCSLGIAVLRKPQGTCWSWRQTEGGSAPGQHTAGTLPAGLREAHRSPIFKDVGRGWAREEGLDMGLVGFT